MKKPTRKKSHSATRSKIAVAATILAIPLLSLPGTGFAEGDNIYLKIRSTDKFSIVGYSIGGSSGGHTVYKNTEGKFFYLDPNGDMKFISLDPPVWKIGSELKKAPTTSNAAANLHIKMTDVIISSYSNDDRGGIKGRSEVSILGLDAKGNTVHENSRGEKFYLDAITGDMIFVDGKGLTAFRNPTPDSSAAPGIVAPSTTGSTNLPGLGSATRSGTASITLNGQFGVVPDLPGERAAPGLPTTGGGMAQLDANSNVEIIGFSFGRVGQPRPVIPADPVILGGPRPIASPDTLAVGGEANSARGQLSTTRGTAPPAQEGGEGQLPGIRGGFILPLIAVTTAPPPADLNGDGKLPGTGIPVGLEGDPGSIKASTITDANGSFHFDKLPAGKYKLTLPDMSPQSVTVDPDGIAGGKVMLGSNGSLRIFDRWGNSVTSNDAPGIARGGIPMPVIINANSVASSSKDEGIKAAATPFSFGSGNTPDVGLGRGGPMNSGPSPVIGGGPMSPMSPGGPGGPAGIRR